MELLSGRAGMQLIRVPYNGGGQAVIDVISGQADTMMSGAGAVIPACDVGFDVAPSSPGELGQCIRSELEQWAPVVKRAKL